VLSVGLGAEQLGLFLGQPEDECHIETISQV
jgi:hypothetical protein